MIAILSPRVRARNAGAALIIVLAFVVLLTGMTLAYFSQSVADRQLAKSSSENATADLLARSALDLIVGDFKQEIVKGSSRTTPPYAVSANAYILPMRSGNPAFNPPPNLTDPPTDPIPNLIRRSVNNGLQPPNGPDPILAPGIPSRAAPINSTVTSANGRSVSAARWNKHYLIPRKNAGSTAIDTEPVTDFTAPDWVLVTRNGPTLVTIWDPNLADTGASNYVIGRYAYAVYDEGGLLDMNVAGFPSANQVDPSDATFNSTYARNIARKGVLAFADLRTTGLSTNTCSGGTLTTYGAIDNMVGWRNYYTGAPRGGYSTFDFPAISCSATSLPSSFLTTFLDTTRDFGIPAVPPGTYSSATRIDQALLNRTELLELRRTLVSSQDAMQYLGTFSRERNAATTWTAATAANVYNKATQRWPINGNLALLVPRSTGGSASGIIQAFGLRWTSASGGVAAHWRYVGPSSTNANDTALNHMPALRGRGDFFQLLHYALHPTWDTSTDDTGDLATTFAIGAAIIDQYHPNNDTYADTGSLTTGTTTTRIDWSGGTVYGMEPNPSSGNAGDPHRPPWAPAPPSGYVALNVPFRNVGEFGYAFKQASTTTSTTLDFHTTTSPDSGVLDFYTYSIPVDSSGSAMPRSGIVNLNTRNPAVLAAILQRATTHYDSSSPSYLGQSDLATDPSKTARLAANAIVNTTSASPALSRANIARLAAASGFGATDEEKETIARALAEVGQTRTWGLLIDVIAQSGRYKPNAAGFADFVVEGEKRYWLHVAIDRFDGTIVGQQLEEVLE